MTKVSDPSKRYALCALHCARIWSGPTFLWMTLPLILLLFAVSTPSTSPFFGPLDIGFFLPSMSYSPFEGSQHRKHAQSRPECKQGEYGKKPLL